MLNLLPFEWKIGLAVGGLIALCAAGGGIVVWLEQDGYARGAAAERARCQQEKADQAAANRKAIDEAEKELVHLADQLSMKQLETADALDRLDAAVDADPHAADVCLDADSVRALNAIR